MQIKHICLISITFLCNLSVVFNVEATRIPPFSGYWYVDAEQTNPSIYPNACNEITNASYELTHVTTSANGSALAAAEKIMFDYFGVNPTSCRIISSIAFPNLPPYTLSDKKLWNFVIAEANNPVILYKTVQCTIPPDDEPYNAYIYVSPHYNVCQDHGCLDTCTGDIVGRSLDVSPPFEGIENMGHVGIGAAKLNRDMNYQYHVLEVLDEDPVIQENSLADFQQRAIYWAAKFEKPKHADPSTGDLNLTAEEAALVYEAGRAQMAFCPQFVLNPDKTHAVEFPPEIQVFNSKTQEWEKQIGMRCAAFRSDTFVNYAYKKALNVTLPLPSRYPEPLPVYTYMSLANIRPHPLANAINQDLAAFFNQRYNSLDEAIKAYKKVKDKNLRQQILVSALTHINADNSLSPNKRTQLFLSAIRQNFDDAQLVEILTNDFISDSHNLEKSLNEIISFFNKADESKIKNYLLRGLAITYTTHLAGKTDQESIEKTIIIKNIFSEQIKMPNNRLFLTALSYLPLVFPYHEIENMISHIQQNKLTADEQQQLNNLIVLIGINYLKTSSNHWEAFWNRYTSTQRMIYAKILSKIIVETASAALFGTNEKLQIKNYLVNNWPTHFSEPSGIWEYDMRIWLKSAAYLHNTLSGDKQPTSCFLKLHNNKAEIKAYLTQFAFEPIEYNSCI